MNAEGVTKICGSFCILRLGWYAFAQCE